ncbi:MAG: queuosine precursor transporter [Thermodesulfobacteriota bacterium]
MQSDTLAQDAAAAPLQDQTGARSLLTAQVLVVSAYVAAQMLSNVASVKIGVVAGLAVDMGTFIYPVTFTLRDLAHKSLGKAATRALILAAGGVNLLMALYLMWAASVPSDPSWGLGEQFSAVLGPVWRIVTASILAQVVSELADTEVYSWFVRKVTTRFQWLRVLASNSVSVPVDNLIFALGAFAFALPWAVVWEIFVFNMLVKYGLTLLSLPMIYLAPQKYSRDQDE